MGKRQQEWRQVYDSHTHLNDDPFYDDVPAFIDRAAHYGVTQLNIVGSNAKLNQRALAAGSLVLAVPRRSMPRCGRFPYRG